MENTIKFPILADGDKTNQDWTTARCTMSSHVMLDILGNFHDSLLFHKHLVLTPNTCYARNAESQWRINNAKGFDSLKRFMAQFGIDYDFSITFSAQRDAKTDLLSKIYHSILIGAKGIKFSHNEEENLCRIVLYDNTDTHTPDTLYDKSGMMWKVRKDTGWFKFKTDYKSHALMKLVCVINHKDDKFSIDEDLLNSLKA